MKTYNIFNFILGIVFASVIILTIKYQKQKTEVYNLRCGYNILKLELQELKESKNKGLIIIDMGDSDTTFLYDPKLDPVVDTSWVINE